MCFVSVSWILLTYHQFGSLHHKIFAEEIRILHVGIFGSTHYRAANAHPKWPSCSEKSGQKHGTQDRTQNDDRAPYSRLAQGEYECGEAIRGDQEVKERLRCSESWHCYVAHVVQRTADDFVLSV